MHLSKGEKKIKFLYGKNSRSLYTAKEFPAKQFKGTPTIEVNFNYKREKMDFKMVCLPNQGSRSKVISDLRKRL